MGNPNVQEMGHMRGYGYRRTLASQKCRNMMYNKNLKITTLRPMLAILDLTGPVEAVLAASSLAGLQLARQV